MTTKNQKFLFGILIVLSGLILLLNNFRVFNLNGEFWWGAAMAILGAVFLLAYDSDNAKKGARYAGMVFIFLGVITMLDSFDFLPSDIIGTLFLWGFGVFFISIYIRNNDRWWVIIPGGILIVLGFVVLLEAFQLLDGDILGFVFLLGTSLVFWFLYLIKDEKNKLGWAKIAAILLTVLSFFILSEAWDNQIAEILFPLSIILCGAYLMISGIKHSKQ